MPPLKHAVDRLGKASLYKRFFTPPFPSTFWVFFALRLSGLIMDIDEDQTVPTSDQDELEELAAATSTDYWLANTRDLSRRRALLRLASSRHKPEGMGNPAQERSPSNHARSNASPPRKRRKVC